MPMAISLAAFLRKLFQLMSKISKVSFDDIYCPKNFPPSSPNWL